MMNQGIDRLLFVCSFSQKHSFCSFCPIYGSLWPNTLPIELISYKTYAHVIFACFYFIITLWKSHFIVVSHWPFQWFQNQKSYTCTVRYSKCINAYAHNILDGYAYEYIKYSWANIVLYTKIRLKYFSWATHQRSGHPSLF